MASCDFSLKRGQTVKGNFNYFQGDCARARLGVERDWVTLFSTKCIFQTVEEEGLPYLRSACCVCLPMIVSSHFEKKGKKMSPSLLLCVQSKASLTLHSVQCQWWRTAGVRKWPELGYTLPVHPAPSLLIL